MRDSRGGTVNLTGAEGRHFAFLGESSARRSRVVALHGPGSGVILCGHGSRGATSAPPELPPESRRTSLRLEVRAVHRGRRPRHFHIEPELNLLVRDPRLSESATAWFGSRRANCSRSLLGRTTCCSRVPRISTFTPWGSSHATRRRRSENRWCRSTSSSRGSELTGVVDRAAAIVDRAGAYQLGAELWQRVHWLGRRSLERAGRGSHVLTRRALQLLDAAPELGLEALATELRANASELSRHFHRDLGMTLVGYSHAPAAACGSFASSTPRSKT